MITTHKTLIALLASSALLWANPAFAQVKNNPVENFSRLGESTALSWDHNTIRAFCRLKDDFVVERVLDTYKKGRRAHGVQLRALLMNELTKRGIKNEEEHQLIKKFFDGVSKKEEHNWAAHQCAVMLLKFGKDQAELNKIIVKDKAIWRRVAVIEAYGRSDKRDWLKHCKTWEAKLMKLK
ncbi:MAG: hypothetical protein P1V97_29145, partial [Planctomycetota bacterium]|nr:hypothetical protein [Planctomycetota bacterium]